MSIRTRPLPPLDRPRLPSRLTREGWWLVETEGGARSDALQPLARSSAGEVSAAMPGPAPHGPQPEIRA